MFYVVPENRSPIASVATFETFNQAKAAAEAIKAETGQNYDIVAMGRVYSTKTFDETHREALDVPHMARD